MGGSKFSVNNVAGTVTMCLLAGGVCLHEMSASIGSTLVLYLDGLIPLWAAVVVEDDGLVFS